MTNKKASPGKRARARGVRAASIRTGRSPATNSAPGDFAALQRELEPDLNELERRLADRTRELEEATAQVELLYRIAPVGLGLQDSELKFLRINDQLAQMAGKTREQCLGRSVREVLPAMADTIEPILKQVLATGESATNIEMTSSGLVEGATTKNTWVWHCHPLRAPGGLLGVSSVAIDISQRKNFENELREQEQKMRTIVTLAADALICIDSQGIIEEFNPAAERIFGYSAGETVGKNIKLLMPSPYREQHDRYLSDYLETGKSSMFGAGRELTGLRKDGSVFPLYLMVREIDHKHRYIGTLRDLSERRILEKELLSIADDVQRTIGESLHDDLGQEMTGLGLQFESLLELLGEGKNPQRQLAERIMTTLDRVRGKVRTFARGLIPAALGSGDLGVALAGLAFNVNETSGIRCYYHYDKELIVKDRLVATQLYHIAQEALNNAVQHAIAHNISLSVEDGNRRLTLKICDDGIGINQEAPSKFGSGLNIMQHRAAVIGGRLSIGQGTSAGTLVTCTIDLESLHDGQ